MEGTAVTVGDAVANATHRLRMAGSPSPRLDAELLVGVVIARERAWLLAHPEAELDADALAALVSRRASGEPIAYIRGFKDWHALRLRTDARALIPRPETEVLLSAAADEIGARLEGALRPVVAWEVGTGSGAVAVALGLQFAAALRDRQLLLIASDTSPDALALAAENARAHGVEELVTLVHGDLLAPAGAAHPRPAVVIASLPYVASDEVDERAGSLAFEPRIAVDGGSDGLVILRRLFAQLPTATEPGATVLLEIGLGQAAEFERLAAPLRASVSAVPDLAGLDRVVRVAMPGSGR